MRNILVFYLLVEFLAAIFHGWASYGWYTWLGTDLNELRGSPDAYYLFLHTHETYLQSQGFVAGLVPASVALGVLAGTRQDGKTAVVTRLLQIGIVLVPIAAFASGYFLALE